MKLNKTIEDLLLPLEEHPSQAYLSNAVQVADVLEWILAQVGPSTVWQTSFSISEEFLRRLYFIQKKGSIKKMYLVLDHKATNKTLKLWVFIQKVMEKTYLADNHSKILLVESEKGDKVSVITSQNLTRGNRYESAFVSTDSRIFNKIKAEIQDVIEKHSVPLSDLLTQRINNDTNSNKNNAD